MKEQIIVGVVVAAATAVVLHLFFNVTEEPKTASALERCVQQHIKPVPGYQRPGAAIVFTQMCKEELRT